MGYRVGGGGGGRGNIGPAAAPACTRASGVPFLEAAGR